MRVGNNDAKSRSANTPETFLQEAEQGKKKIYLEACFQQRQHFSPFVTSVDGLLGVKVATNLKRIAIRLVTKWQKPYSRTCRYIKSIIVITVVWATHWYIRGSRVPAHKISVQRPHWEYGAGINLFR